MVGDAVSSRGEASAYGTGPTTAKASAPQPPTTVGRELGDSKVETIPTAAAASDVRFSFVLMDESGSPAFVVDFSHHDVRTVKALVLQTSLNTLEPQHMCGPLLGQAIDGCLAKKFFDQKIRKLIRFHNLSKENMKAFSVLLSAIFYTFEGDEVEDQDADALELALGMSMLCTGDKSSKLLYAWQVMDLDSTGLLDAPSLRAFMRSFLRMLVALSFEASSRPLSETKAYTTGMANWLTEQIMRDYSNDSGLVSFDDFAQWYTDGGYQVAPWIEVLDLKKWALA